MKKGKKEQGVISKKMNAFASKVDRLFHRGRHNSSQNRFFLNFVQHLTTVGTNALFKGLILSSFLFFSVFFLTTSYINTDGACATNEVPAKLPTASNTKVFLNEGGEINHINTTATTVRDFLKEQKVTIGFNEQVFPSTNSPIEPNMTISVGIAQNTTRQEEQPINFAVRQVNDVNLEVGKENVETEGKQGKSLNVLIVQKIGDVEVSQTVFSSQILTPPTEKIVRVGAMPEIPDPGDITGIQAVAKELLPSYGWDSNQIGCLVNLWNRESGWDTYAQNSSSGAYGIPQALPGSKMGMVASDWKTNPVTQIKWGLGYIAGRYGSPCGAWSFFQGANWY